MSAPANSLYVIVQNGRIDSVETDDPRLLGVRIVVVESNDDAASGSDVQTIDCNGNLFEARPRVMTVESLSIDVAPLDAVATPSGGAPDGTAIDEAIDSWHRSGKGHPLDLHGHLGWTLDEYTAWVGNPAAIPDRPLAGPIGIVNRSANDLQERRNQAANAVYEAYDFGSDVEIDADGWETTIPGDEFMRLVYLADRDGGDSVMSRFVVIFHPGSAIIAEASAISASGSTFGRNTIATVAVDAR